MSSFDQSARPLLQQQQQQQQPQQQGYHPPPPTMAHHPNVLNGNPQQTHPQQQQQQQPQPPMQQQQQQMNNMMNNMSLGSVSGAPPSIHQLPQKFMPPSQNNIQQGINNNYQPLPPLPPSSGGIIPPSINSMLPPPATGMLPPSMATGGGGGHIGIPGGLNPPMPSTTPTPSQPMGNYSVNRSQPQQMMPPPQQSAMPPPLPQQTNFNHQGPPQMAPGYPQQQQPPSVHPGQFNNHIGQPNMPPQPNPYYQQQQQQPPPSMPGQYPSRYGQQQQPPLPGHHYNQVPPMGEPPQQQRRLDPDNMPNPIQVMTENQCAHTEPFVTNQPGLMPPLVTTDYITHDQGNSAPKFIRSTMYYVPTTADIMKQASVPFSLIISPFAKLVKGEIQPPIVDFGEVGPIRCIRCKAYMSPNMQFIDAGRRFQCLLCKATTEVPQEYFQHLDHTGQRVDKFERPELVLGTYEFVATKDYCRNNKPPNAPGVIFLIDVSYNNIKSGLVNLICSEMKNIIKNLPIDQGRDRSCMKVGFITYNSTVHFYNIKNNLAVPQMMVVGDLNEMFMPLLDGFLCDPEESAGVIDLLMEQIPKMFAGTAETETILYPAIQAGLEALRASECVGKLLVFHSTLPVADAPGKLKNRDDRNVLGTEKEKTVLMPQCTNYNNLGQECVQSGCAVDLFVFNNSYIDLATIGQICRLTGGEIYKYTYFQADIDGHRVIQDVVKNISSISSFDTVMRVRTSTGIRPTDFYGHFYMSNTTDMEIAAIDCNKSIAIEVKHDDKLSAEDIVYIQVALLYTSCGGQRRLRIFNLSLKTCNVMTDLFRCCDLDTLMLFLNKQIMFKLMDVAPRLVKEELEGRCAQILACYRKHCASPSSAGQLILPECMKLLPLYVSCLMKNDAISGGSDMTCDDRSYVMQFVLIMDLPMSVSYIYPRLIPIHDVDANAVNIPSPIRTTIEKITDDGAYILENGVHMFIWLGLALAPDFTQQVFGAPSAQQIDTDRSGLPVLDNPLSKRIHGIIASIQSQRPRCMRVTLVRQRDKLENVFKHFLIEDPGTNGMPSYVEYLCYLHKEIRTLLS